MTNCRMADMRNKEVISVKDGTRLGAVSDVEIELKTARISAIIIYGRLKWLGLLGREDDIVIRWEDIQIIGEETILVDFAMPFRPKKRFGSGWFHT
ncbi:MULTISPECIES: YlmC/YmxH family sporulation protein [Clostridium]|uniref:YlmC/YmxH family sporulation protein n=1 Tax=Clostridium TaxID=1485 RepID=UPI000A27154B|nr:MULTISPECIES: YlmC/YmxH family sporulation protein [Clostridium]MDU7337420.1 YlmC/YmxH family sporulation protein [Clostridium sp.]